MSPASQELFVYVLFWDGAHHSPFCSAVGCPAPWIRADQVVCPYPAVQVGECRRGDGCQLAKGAPGTSFVITKKSDPPCVSVSDETPTLPEQELGDTGVGTQMVDVFWAVQWKPSGSGQWVSREHEPCLLTSPWQMTFV